MIDQHEKCFNGLGCASLCNKEILCVLPFWTLTAIYTTEHRKHGWLLSALRSI